YQYITDPHTFTAQTTYIHEKQSWDASFPSGGIGAGPTPTLASTNLDTLKAKATYYYQRKYGATLAYISTTGTADAGLYGAQTASPDSTAYVAELDYLPLQNVKVMLQYTVYTKFNGAGTNYDGNGRNARDNNTLFLNLWFAF
ncbi:MAG TPA: cytochrome C, partial [Burkholderiales bacterium]|nr:cytochrome C [Burkholderiales bacterium]